MTPLRQKMIDAMLVRGFSKRTQHSYLDAVSHLALYFHLSPEVISTEQMQVYFLYLIKERKLSEATCRLYYNGIRFCYLKVLGWKSFQLNLSIPKKKQKIPELLTRKEVTQILSALVNPKHRALLRVSELVKLKVRHIDSSRYLLRIEQAKGGKDRHVILTESLLLVLRNYWQAYRPYEYLFYARSLDTPISITSAQRIFNKAKNLAAIEKIGGIHSLRHAYATHQLEAGLAIHQLQQLLGHQDVRTTIRYAHWLPHYRPSQGENDLLKGMEVGDE